MDSSTATDVFRETSTREAGPQQAAPAGAPVLHYRRCRWCRSATLHSRFLCPSCGATELDEAVSAGLGVVSRLGATRGSFQLVHRVPHACVVTLDEGFTLTAVLAEDRPRVVPLGARVVLHAEGTGPRSFEFRLA
jgi:uncharacterized OB-fold protein